MNGALREAEVVDPKWARKERRKQLLLMAATGGALVAIAIGTVAFVLGVHNSTEITQVEHSACQVEPEGRACQVARRESAKAESIATACISFRQVGYPCPRPGSKVASRHEEVMPSSPSTGHSLPGRHEGGSGATDQPSHPHAPSVPHQSAPSTEGSMGAASAPAPTAPSSPGTSSSSTTERTTEAVVVETPAEPEAPVRAGLGTVVESVGGVVEETGGTVDEAVGGVQEPTCSLAKLLCP